MKSLVNFVTNIEKDKPPDSIAKALFPTYKEKSKMPIEIIRIVCLAFIAQGLDIYIAMNISVTPNK
jgi:hypothetical protein